MHGIINKKHAITVLHPQHHSKTTEHVQTTRFYPGFTMVNVQKAR